MVKVTVGKKVITTGSTSVSVREFGAVGDGDLSDHEAGTDDSAAFQAAIDSLPATGGEIRIPGKGVYKIQATVEVNKPNVHIVMDDAATIDIFKIGGVGVPDVHFTVNMLMAFRVSADDCSFTGGRITGRVSNGGLNLCGILVDGVDNFTASYISLDSMYTSVWAGGGCFNLKYAYLKLDGCSHNLIVGYHDSQPSTTSPQVDKAIILGIDSKNSSRDGMKLNAFADRISIIGGHYYDNERDGIDTFVSGEFLSISGVHCTGNGSGVLGGSGIDMKFAALELTGVFGRNRMCMVHNCIFRGNDDFGMSASTSTDLWPDMDIDGFSIIGNIAEGNTRQGFFIGMRRGCMIGNIARNNGSRGFNILSAHDMAFIGNIADRNNTISSQSGFVFQRENDINKGRRLAIIGNTAIGSGLPTGQRIGFDMPEAENEDLIYIGNNSINHDTNNYNVGFAFSSDMRMRDNRGVETENTGLSAAISSGGTIAHGLDSRNTPDYVSVIPNGSGPTGVSVTANSTNLTVTFSGGGSHTFFWTARHSVSH